MPTPHGRDRLEKDEKGRPILHGPFDKGWVARGPSVTGSVPTPGTAVRWDDVFYEVLEVIPAPVGVRYLLDTWNDGTVIRGRVEDYTEEAEAARRASRVVAKPPKK